jgi:dTDP-4-dehydrorhamnose reductase
MVRVDLQEEAETQQVVEAFRPDAVIHCAARPSVDWCEENPGPARRLNCEATLNVLEAAERVGARLVFLSTDYVFDGRSGPYLESAPTRPLNAYGRMKLKMEEAILGSRGEHVVVRTTNVYGFDLESKNFLMVVLARLGRGETVGAAEDQYGTPTHVEDLCRVTRGLLEDETGGLFHVAGPDYLDRVEWARAAAAAFDLPAGQVRGAVTSSLDQAARRPLRAGLATERLGADAASGLRALEEGLAEMRRQRDRLPPGRRPF